MLAGHVGSLSKEQTRCLTSILQSSQNLLEVFKVNWAELDGWLSLNVELTEASHEIRTPLMAIIGYTELMLAGKAGSLSEKQTSFLTSILQFSQNLLEVFEYLFELYRAVSGKLSLNVEEVDLNQLLQQAKSDKIQFNVPDELPKIWADRRRLYETVRLIIAETTGSLYNAEASQAILTVNHDDAWITFNITTGGEAPSYFRDHPNPSLFLSRAIIETHGGQLKVEKQKENSLGITFTLPIDQNKPGEEDPILIA